MIEHLQQQHTIHYGKNVRRGTNGLPKLLAQCIFKSLQVNFAKYVSTIITRVKTVKNKTMNFTFQNTHFNFQILFIWPSEFLFRTYTAIYATKNGKPSHAESTVKATHTENVHLFTIQTSEIVSCQKSNKTPSNHKKAEFQRFLPLSAR